MIRRLIVTPALAALVWCVAMPVMEAAAHAGRTERHAKRAEAARGAAAVAGSARVVRDMLGREVRVPATVTRIVSLVPSVTETIFALGGADTLVGVTTFCDHPPAARAKAKVGGIVNPSLEAIAALRPELVVATTEGNRTATVDQLSALGVATYVVSPKSFAGVVDSVQRLGALIGRDDAARQLVAELERRASRVVDATRRAPRPRVLFVIWAEPLVVPGRDTLVSELIRMSGGVSVSGEEPVPWPRFSLEQVVASAPDVIVGAADDGKRVEQTLRRWREQGLAIPALARGRVHMVDATLLHRPGPRILDGLETLARAIHPGAMP